MRQQIKIKPECFNESFFRFLHDNTPTQIFYGGAGSGKSVFLARRAVLDVAMFDRNYLIARGTQRSIRSSTWNEITDAIRFLKLTPYFRENKSEFTITCTYNERQFVFVGCDDVEKLKSIRPREGVFTDLWEEEATEISNPTHKQLRLRMRGKSECIKRNHLSFNPIYRTHWIYKEYFAPNGVPEDVTVKYITNKCQRFSGKKRQILIFRTTYKDNRFLEQQDIDELLSLQEGDKYYFQVYAEGKWGVLGHRIFTDWEIRNLDNEYYSHVSSWRNGLDFGFTNDPTAFSRSTMIKNEIHIPEVPGGEIYATGMMNPDIQSSLSPIVGKERVFCDCAEPKSITELRQGRNSINAVGVKKGKDSVLHGIQWLQRHKIVVDPSNQHAINELSLYRWEQDKEGNPYNKPVDKDNHFIDSLRYAWEDQMTPSKPMMAVSKRAHEVVRKRRDAEKEMKNKDNEEKKKRLKPLIA